MSDTSIWYVGINGAQQGPLGTQQVIDLIRSGQVGQTAYVYGQGLAKWTPISQVPTFAQVFHHGAPPPPPPPPPGPAPAAAADVIDYEIFGDEMQFVEVTLDPHEAAVAEAGSFFYMEPGIETSPGPSLTTYANRDQQRRKIAFAAPSPGKIVALDLRALGGALVCAKGAFLCAARGISLGDGGPLQKLEGHGLAFVRAGGTLVARELAAGESLRVAAGCVVAFEPKVQYDLTSLTGPGKIWLRSIPGG